MNRKLKAALVLSLLAIPITVYAKIGPKQLKDLDTPTDEECLTYEATGTGFEWQNCIASATGDLTLENSEVIDNGTDGTINFGRNDAGTVTLGSIDDDTTADLTINAGGVSTITIGGTTDTVIVDADTGLTLGNTESVNTETDAVFDFTRNDAGVVTFTCSDNDATAGCTYDAGGASPIVIGSADVTNIQFRGDTDFDFANGATGNVDVSLRDYADTTDDDMAHTLLRTNCTDTGSASEDCDFSILVPEGGAAVSSRFSIDADGGVTVGGATNDTVILAPDVDVQIQGQATGNVTLDFRDYADTADDDMAHVIQTVNCTDAGSATEDCDFTLGVVEGGAAADTRFNIDADAGITLGSSNNGLLTFSSDDTGDAEEVHVVNSVGPSDLVGVYKELVFCGENAENTTVYFGPATGPFGGDGSDISQTSTGCDALDNADEGTADALISTLATKIHGMYCTTDATLAAGETIDFTLRTAVGNAATTDGAATTLTCQIGEAQTACRVNTGTTTNIAASATVAMQVAQSSNNGDGDESWCSVFVSFP